MKKSALLLLSLLLGSIVHARPVASVKEVQTVFDAGASGNAYFNSRLRASMRNMGLRFVRSRQIADAILRSDGDWKRGGGFSGSASLTTPTGRVLWSARVNRAPDSRAMAFDSLAAKLRAARK